MMWGALMFVEFVRDEREEVRERLASQDGLPSWESLTPEPAQSFSTLHEDPDDGEE